MNAPRFGLYVHVPFCSALCPYCDFAVVVGRHDLHERYLDALVEEARVHAWGARAGSVFIGGGTPSLVDAKLLARTLSRLRNHIGWDDDVEVTLEANPESVSRDGLATLRAAGCNRVSIGAQSFDDGVLKALGRTHVARDIGRAVADARAAGIENVSLDLIYGGLDETDASWKGSINEAVALDVEHISCYALTIEERTLFGKAVAQGRMRAPDEDALAERFELACDALPPAGFEHYEISNWARPGRYSRHNLVYWTQGDYLGLGLGAHSHRDGARWWNTRTLTRYLADPANARDGEENLNDTQRAEEWLMLQLRLVEGVDLGEAEERLGRALDTAPLECDGLARIRENRLELTTRGMLLENRVALHLLGNPVDTTSV